MINREVNESYIGYIKRVTDACANKQIDYVEWGNAILGIDNCYSSENLRKSFYVVNKMIDKIDEDSYTSNEIKDELEKIKADIKNEKIKLQTLNLERNRLDREKARQELFYEQIGQYIKSHNYEKISLNKHPNNQEMKYLLGIADIHANAYWNTLTNEYSMKIVKDRFEILLENVVNFIDKHQLNEFNIILLGDIIDGVLRMSNLQMMDSSISKAIVDISDIIIDFIEQLVSKTKVHINLFDVVYSNHSMPRFLQNYDIREDLGYTISKYIATGLKNNQNVNMFSPINDDLYLDFKIWDFNLIGLHGHTEKNQENTLSDLTLIRRKLYDYVVMGHLHSAQKITNSIGGSYDVETIVFPSFVGDDPYSNSIHKLSKGACMICGFDKTYGLTETYKIILN